MFNLNLSRLELGLLRQREARLRRNEKILSEQIEKLGKQFTKTLSLREKLSKEADEIEKRLFEEEGRVIYLKKRKSPATKSTEVKPDRISQIVAMATNAKLPKEERLRIALEMIKKG